MSSRYDRQQRIRGWDQRRLTEARVAVVGARSLGAFTAAGLAALGVGEIVLVDGAPPEADPWFRPWAARRVGSAAESLAGLIANINPDVRVTAVPVSLLHEDLGGFIPEANVIVDATGSGASARVAIATAARVGAQAVVAWARPGTGACWACGPATGEPSWPSRTGPEAPVESMAVAAFVLDEVRRRLMPRKGDELPAEGEIRYEQATGVAPRDSSRPRRALVVGAGALGTFVALGLALRRWHITVIDRDVIEQTNLNRQILYFGSVGRPKATTLTARLEELGTCAAVRGWVGDIEHQMMAAGDYDVAFSCVDSYRARACLNRLCARARTPLVNGGTAPFGGELMSYVPGRSACLDCQIAVEALAAEEAGPLGCARQEASTVISNQLIGALMVAEAEAVSRGEPSPGVLEFDASRAQRIQRRPGPPACSCHEGHR